MDFKFQRQIRLVGSIAALVGLIATNWTLVLFGWMVVAIGYMVSFSKIEIFIENLDKKSEDN